MAAAAAVAPASAAAAAVGIVVGRVGLEVGTVAWRGFDGREGLSRAALLVMWAGIPAGAEDPWCWER